MNPSMRRGRPHNLHGTNRKEQDNMKKSLSLILCLLLCSVGFLGCAQAPEATGAEAFAAILK